MGDIQCIPKKKENLIQFVSNDFRPKSKQYIFTGCNALANLEIEKNIILVNM